MSSPAFEAAVDGLAAALKSVVDYAVHAATWAWMADDDDETDEATTPT